MIIQPMTRQEEAELVAPFKNDLVLLFNELKRELLQGIKNAKTPQEALDVVTILEEPYEEED